jgi:hypothetical protein
MRTWLLLVLAADCGKTLNPDYCSAHPTDTDCEAAYTYVDAGPPCSADTDCKMPGKTVCDAVAHACVECTPTDHATCTGVATVCSASDVCVGCVQSTDCPDSGVCLMSSNTCAASDSILHVEPNGSTTSNCIETMKCTLDHAIAIADPSHHVIQLDDGTYSIADTMNLSLIGIHLVPTAGAAPKVNVTDGKTVFNITADAELDGIEIVSGSSTAIKCSTNANVVLEQIYEHGSQSDGFDADTCTLLIERSRFYSNMQSGLYAHDSAVTLRNSFFYGNGNTGYRGAAVTFDGTTTGKMEFNTLSYNQGYDGFKFDLQQHKLVPDQDGGALDCNQDQNSAVNLIGNLFIEDQPFAYTITVYSQKSACTGNFTTNNLIGTASDAMFVSQTDEHLTEGTPTGQGKVRDDTSADCSDVPTDFDGDTRPQNNACDYGADELKAP